MGQYTYNWNIGSGSYTEYRHRNPEDSKANYSYRDHMIKDYTATSEQEKQLAKKLNKDVSNLTKKQRAKAVIYKKCDGSCDRSTCHNGIIGGQHSLETHANQNGFYTKYGITSEDLAIQEGVSSTALNMRHMKFGSVWQRKAKPTELEKLFHKTQVELAHELGVHPVTIMARFKRYGTPYHVRHHMIKNNAGENVRCSGKCGFKNCYDGILEHPMRDRTMSYKKILFPECSDLRENRADATKEYKIMFDKYVKKIGGIEWHSVVKNKQKGYDLYVKDMHEVDLHWTELLKYKNSKFWLHENHKDYPHTERAGL
jgi:ferredoxin